MSFSTHRRSQIWGTGRKTFTYCMNANNLLTGSRSLPFLYLWRLVSRRIIWAKYIFYIFTIIQAESLPSLFFFVLTSQQVYSSHIFPTSLWQSIFSSERTTWRFRVFTSGLQTAISLCYVWSLLHQHNISVKWKKWW